MIEFRLETDVDLMRAIRKILKRMNFMKKKQQWESLKNSYTISLLFCNSSYPFYCSGHGSMGISNSIGSNTFDILLCLGLPWLIKSSFSPTQPGRHYISINSGGLEYSAISLLSTLMLLYIAFASNKFQLDRKVGRACLCMYAVFLILASLIELNVFFTVNLPTCQRTVKWSRHPGRWPARNTCSGTASLSIRAGNFPLRTYRERLDRARGVYISSYTESPCVQF